MVDHARSEIVQLQIAVDELEDDGEVLLVERVAGYTVGLPLKDGIIRDGAVELESPADVIRVADSRIESGGAVGLGPLVGRGLVELPIDPYVGSEMLVIDEPFAAPGFFVRSRWNLPEIQ